MEVIGALVDARVPLKVYAVTAQASRFLPMLAMVLSSVGVQLPPIDPADLPRSPAELKGLIAQQLYQRPAEELAGLLSMAAQSCEAWLDEYAAATQPKPLSPPLRSAPPTTPLSQPSYGDVPASDTPEAPPPEEIASDGSRAHDDATPAAN